MPWRCGSLAAADIHGTRSHGVPGEPRLAALSRLAWALIETRGRPDPSDRAAFLDEGFTPEHLPEVIAVSAASTITNYAANVTEPPLEEELAEFRWQAA